MQQSSLWLERILRRAIATPTFPQADYQVLVESRLLELGDAIALQTPYSEATVQENLTLLHQIYPACCTLFPQDPLLPLWTTWLPLARWIARQRQAQERPLIQGILGLQGTGKTTLARLLQLVLEQLGYKTLCLSLDDLYLTYEERQALRCRDPRLIWRGQPGTHDLELGWQTLTALRSPTQSLIPIPRFDKAAWAGAGDRAPTEWTDPRDIILFEGWFVGLRPLDPQVFASAPPPIVTDEDRQFARDSNQRLQDYLPLWELIDRLLVLRPVHDRLSYQWRQQAEQQLHQTRGAGMTAAEVTAFVDYFWQALHPQLFMPHLLQHSEWVDVVVEIAANHNPAKLNCPNP